MLASYQKLMKGLAAQQAPDGMWRQVVDEPGSYREFTVTAMVLTALARGVRLGWLEPGEFRPVADRAWRGLLARIAEDGTLLDVCTGTGFGPDEGGLPYARGAIRTGRSRRRHGPHRRDRDGNAAWAIALAECRAGGG